MASETGNPSKKSSSCLFFEKLPREIRDIVHGYAFVDGNETIELVELNSAVWNAKRERTSNYHSHGYFSGGLPATAPRDFPTCPFSAMVVSRKFYDEATDEWACNKVIRLSAYHNFSNLQCKTEQLRAKLQKITLRGHDSGWGAGNIRDFVPSGCTNLRHLTITITQGVFNSINPCKVPCIDQYTPSELAEALPFDPANLPSLNTVKLEADRCSYVASEEEEQIWQANVSALESFCNGQIEEFKATGMAGEKTKPQNKTDQEDEFGWAGDYRCREPSWYSDPAVKAIAVVGIAILVAHVATVSWLVRSKVH